jgi:hypothetical protein
MSHENTALNLPTLSKTVHNSFLPHMCSTTQKPVRKWNRPGYLCASSSAFLIAFCTVRLVSQFLLQTGLSFRGEVLGLRFFPPWLLHEARHCYGPLCGVDTTAVCALYSVVQFHKGTQGFDLGRFCAGGVIDGYVLLKYGVLLVSIELWPVIVSCWGIVLICPLSFIDVFDYIICLTIRDAVGEVVFLWYIWLVWLVHLPPHFRTVHSERVSTGLIGYSKVIEYSAFQCLSLSRWSLVVPLWCWFLEPPWKRLCCGLCCPILLWVVWVHRCQVCLGVRLSVFWLVVLIGLCDWSLTV